MAFDVDAKLLLDAASANSHTTAVIKPNTMMAAGILSKIIEIQAMQLPNSLAFEYLELENCLACISI